LTEQLNIIAHKNGFQIRIAASSWDREDESWVFYTWEEVLEFLKLNPMEHVKEPTTEEPPKANDDL
jgi:hypothetical protein